MNHEQKFIEIPFGAKDSELKGWEYTIPDGMEAIVKDGKVIVKEKESEDERIRKTLLDEMMFLKEKGQAQLLGLDINDIIAYLEKQKELPFVKDVVLGLPGLYFYDGERMHFQGSPTVEEKQKEQKPNIELIQRSWYMEGYIDGEFKREPMWNLVTGKGGPRYEKNEKYGQPLEQKPTEWGEGDEKMLSYIICAIRNHYTIDPIKDELINWLRTRPFQISAQWDVEQQWCFEDVIALLIADGHEREANVLKTLFNQSKIGLSKEDVDNAVESFNSKRKQEWSEEDELMRKRCVADLGYLTEYEPQYKERYDAQINWLKSIRPKCVNVSDQTLQLLICYLYACHDVAKRDWEKADCRRYISYLEDLDYTLKNRWKPSEEQMEAPRGVPPIESIQK